MNSISTCAKDIVREAVRVLNTPVVKEGVKNIAGSVTFAFGIMELYDISQILRGRKISTEIDTEVPSWLQVANKISIICAKISLILSAGVSRPGIYIISNLAGSLFSAEQLKRAFGSNTIFAVNPWHPRHVVSIAAVALALPSIVITIGKGVNWTCSKLCQYKDQPDMQYQSSWLTDAKVRVMVIFNTVTSRPILHVGNQAGRFILRA